MQLSRESILRMFEGSGSGGSGGGAGSSQLAAMLQGYATQSWVDENYVGIEFFNRLFRMHGDNDTVIVPNDLDTTIQNIEARFGLWTESFLSALGLNSSGSGGGGGGSVSYLNDLLDVSITNPTVGEGLIYDGTRWVNGPIGGGGTGSVESVGLSMPTGFSVTGSPVTSSGTLAVGFASGYSLPPTSKQAQWDAAYSWGDHSQEGYATQSWVNAKGYTTNAGTVTSVRMTVPAGLTVTGSPITTSGTLAISLGTGYSIPTTAKQSQWDTAYSWGDHSQEGYATQSWVNAKGYTTNTGTVTSVRMTVPAGLTVTGSPITTSGTLAISLGTGYSIPTTAKQSQWDTAYGWGNHADAGYATEEWVNGKGYATQSALTSAVSRIITLEGFFTNGVANQAARLSGTSTYQAWGQTFWQNGTPKSIGSASARANINYAGSVNMGHVLAMEYDGNDVHDPAIYMKSSKTESNLPVLMLHNDNVHNTDHHLAIGFGTSARAQLPIRFFGREFVFNYTTDTVNSSGYYQTAEAMKVGYRQISEVLEEPAVYVRKHLMIGNGAGDYFPVTYDSANNALCFTGNIYATGGVSALGFSSTQNGGALINGQLDVAAAMNVSGDATMNGDLSVAGEATLGSLKITNGTNTYTLDVAAAIRAGILK